MSASAAAPGLLGERVVENGGRRVISFRDRHHSHGFEGSFPEKDNQDPVDSIFPSRFVQTGFILVMTHYFLWVWPMLAFLVAVYSIFPIAAAVLLLLYLRSYFDRCEFKNGREWTWLRNLSVWKLAQRYQEVEVVREAELDPNHRYIFGVYPHGILILSRVCLYGNIFDSHFPGIETRTLAASPMFYLPGCREICLWMGAVNAAKRTARYLLDNTNKSLVVYPGGSAEIFTTDPNSTDTVLIERTGFIRLAMESGTDLVPAFVFGEKWLYCRADVPKAVKNFFYNTFRMPILLFWGKWYSWAPMRGPLSMVFGKPIPVKKVANPTQEQVNALHAKYMAEIERLYHEYKGDYGYGEEETLSRRKAKSSRNKKAAKAKKDE